MSYPAREAKCIECGKTFMKKCPRSTRCRPCSEEYRAQRMRENSRRRYELMKGRRKEVSKNVEISKDSREGAKSSICNTKTCSKCIYSYTLSGTLACNYISITGHSRGCLAGIGCDKRETKKRKKADGA